MGGASLGRLKSVNVSLINPGILSRLLLSALGFLVCQVPPTKSHFHHKETFTRTYFCVSEVIFSFIIIKLCAKDQNSTAGLEANSRALILLMFLRFIQEEIYLFDSILRCFCWVFQLQSYKIQKMRILKSVLVQIRILSVM